MSKDSITAAYMDAVHSYVERMPKYSFIIGENMVCQANKLLEYFNYTKLILSGYEILPTESFKIFVERLSQRHLE